MGIREDAAQSRMKKKVEEALRSKMKTQALKECDPLVAKWAECARGRTFSVIWACRAQSKETNVCLHNYTNDEVFAKYKKQYEGRNLTKIVRLEFLRLEDNYLVLRLTVATVSGYIILGTREWPVSVPSRSDIARLFIQQSDS